MKMGLILIDIQNDYFKGGKYELFKPEQAAEEAKKVLSFFRKNKWPVFHIQHINDSSDGGFFIPGTYGVEINNEVHPKGQELIIKKHTPNSFFDTKLKESLENQKVDHLVMCGMMTHMCVDTTVRAAANYGYKVTLIEDACATRDLNWHDENIPAFTVQQVFLASVNGTFANVKSADQFIKEQHQEKDK